MRSRSRFVIIKKLYFRLLILSLVPSLTEMPLTPLLTAQAAPPSFSSNPQTIPEQPTIPSPLQSIPTIDPFQCDRQFIYRGEKLNCDSATRQDGERLRPIIANVPEAVEELNIYQQNRRSVRVAAYVSTIGLLVAVGGFFLSRSYTDENNQLTEQGNTLRIISVGGGLGLSLGSVLYGISVLRNNEQHLGRAVQKFNDANPKDSIEIQFSTGFLF